VQGVGFRVFTQKLAAKMHLVGWVRNLRDGSVEAMVQGEDNVVVDFENQLRSGPSHSRVENFIAKDAQGSDGWNDFIILQDGVDSCIKK
jgi:acylphosphatase